MFTYYFYVFKKTQKLHIGVPQSFLGSFDFSNSSNDETIINILQLYLYARVPVNLHGWIFGESLNSLSISPPTRLLSCF